MATWFLNKGDTGIFTLVFLESFLLLYRRLNNILHRHRTKAFELFLSAPFFPFSLLSVLLSDYAQAIAVMLFIIGWKVRPAAAIMCINFTVAVLMVHRGQTFEEVTTILLLIVSPVVLLFTGTEKLAIGAMKSPVILDAEKDH